MAYDKFNEDWKDFPETDTPASAEAFEHIEQGISDTADVADTALSDAGTAAADASAAGSAAANAQADATAAQSDATLALGNLASHEADTTNIHGIANTGLLETTAGAQSKADAKVVDTAYGVGWNGDTDHAPSRNTVYDKIESLGAGASVDDTPYDATTWNGVTAVAPSKNVVRDQFELTVDIADSSVAGFGFVLDEDDMASNSATKLATQQSIKAYVDSLLPTAADSITASVALTDQTPNSTSSSTQWGTEECVIANIDLPHTDFVVLAWLTGRAKFNASVAAGDRCSWKLQYSLDSGGSWSDMAGTNGIATAYGATTTARQTVAANAYNALTTTGNGVQVRATCWDLTQAGDFTFEQGRLSILVVQQV